MMKCKKVNVRKVLMLSVLIVAFVSVSVGCASAGGIPLFTYTGDVLPSADGWIIVGYASYESTGAHVEDGVLHITDFSSGSGTCIHYRREWPISPDYINVAEFDIKVVSCSSLYGIWIGASDDDYNMFYTLFPDRIQSNYRHQDFVDHLGEVYYFDTTSQFNTYTAVIDNGIAKLYINGDLVLEQPAGTGTYYTANINSVGFGSASSPATGEAYFDEVRAYTLEFPTEDILSISTDKTSYNLGDRVRVTLEINRSEAEPRAMMLELELQEPCDAPDMLYQSQLFVMPAVFQKEVTLPIRIDRSIWVSSGEYSFTATLRDPNTDEVIDTDTATFEIDDEMPWEKSLINKLKKFLP